MSLESVARKPIIAVVGTKDFKAHLRPPLPPDLKSIAETVGKEVATNKCWLLCGGLTGVMEAAACGAKNIGGFTIGIIPKAVRELEDNHKDEWPNRFIDVAIFTGLGGGVNGGRNEVIVNSCDAMIALPGSNRPDPDRGTRSEINFAIEKGVPVVLYKYWRDVKDPIAESTPTVQYFTADAEEAVSKALAAISDGRHKTTSRR